MKAGWRVVSVIRENRGTMRDEGDVYLVGWNRNNVAVQQHSVLESMFILFGNLS